MRVLIVEAETTTRTSVARMLRSRGWAVTECADAQAGGNAFVAGRYPLVVLSATLPGSAGLDLCRRLRSDRRGKNTVILMLTSRTENDALEAVLEAGADDYLPVPFDVSVLKVRLAIAENRVRDLLEKREGERDRRRMEHRILQAQKFESLGILAGGIAHDFNNLLVGILGYTHLALMDGANGDDVREYLERIESTTTHASELTSQLLAYSGRGALTTETVDLNDVAPEMAALIEVSNAAGVKMICERGEFALPVEADPTQLRQVIMNMVKNASDAVGKGPGEIRVSTGRTEIEHGDQTDDLYPRDVAAGSYAYVEVVDTGVGMDDATRTRMFDPCFSTKPDGFGLGLAAAIGIVRSHGGAIRVHSTVGVGTQIRVLLPLACRARRKAVQVAHALGLGEWRGSGRVLVVDDEENMRSIASVMLRRLGFEVATAADGARGLALLAEANGSVVAVLLDMSMPGLSGIETLREIRKHSAVPVVVCSGYDETEAMERFAPVESPVPFLKKPFRPQELADCFRLALEGAATSPQLAPAAHPPA